MFKPNGSRCEVGDPGPRGDHWPSPGSRPRDWFGKMIRRCGGGLVVVGRQPSLRRRRTNLRFWRNYHNKEGKVFAIQSRAIGNLLPFFFYIFLFSYKCIYIYTHTIERNSILDDKKNENEKCRFEWGDPSSVILKRIVRREQPVLHNWAKKT